jgi:hypothetical protein
MFAGPEKVIEREIAGSGVLWTPLSLDACHSSLPSHQHRHIWGCAFWRCSVRTGANAEMELES